MSFKLFSFQYKAFFDSRDGERERAIMILEVTELRSKTGEMTPGNQHPLQAISSASFLTKPSVSTAIPKV